MDSAIVPASLLVLSLLSCAHLQYCETHAGPSIQLPPDGISDQSNGYRRISDNDDDDDEADKRSLREQQEAEDEGVAVEEDEWWYRVRLRKTALVGVLALTDAVACVMLGWDATSGAKRRLGLVEDALMVVFWTILVILSVLSFVKHRIADHWRYTVHITILTSVVATSIWARILIPESGLSIPDEDLFNISSAPSEEIVSFALTITLASLSTIAFLIAGTTPRSPAFHFQSPYTYKIESDGASEHTANVAANIQASVLGLLLFSWVTPVMYEGAKKLQMDLDDLPHLSAGFRTITLFRNFRQSAWLSVKKRQAEALSTSTLQEAPPRDGLGYAPRWVNRLIWRLIVVNKLALTLNCTLAFVSAFLYYLPALFLQKVVAYLEVANQGDQKSNRLLGYAYCFGLLLALLLNAIVSGQLWFISNTMLSTKIRVQLNSVIFAKTLRRKDVLGTSEQDDDSDKSQVDKTKPVGGPKAAQQADPAVDSDSEDGASSKAENETFSRKAQVLNLFSVDCDRIADSAGWSYSLIDAPIELVVGTYFLYKLLGYAGLVGIGITVLFLPVNHITSKGFAKVQDSLMSARDKRVSLMNEVLSSIRFIKFMAYERAFEKRILSARGEELRQQRNTYLLEVAFNLIWGVSPIVCILTSFFVYTKIMQRDLTPSIAFTALAVFHELTFAINVLPDTFISALQCFVSLRRVERYLETPDVENVGTENQIVELHAPVRSTLVDPPIAFVNATITWPSADPEASTGLSPMLGTRTPGGRTPGGRKFIMPDVSVDFPLGEMTLISGSLGSGKTLLLLALLGEAELLSGQIVCPRSPVDTITVTTSSLKIDEKDWLLPVCAYVPQGAWLLNASIQDNILFGLPMNHERYQATLESCSLLSDLRILEDGDQTEIGEKGVNLSGGQKTRVSLARAVYSRASYVLLDDVLSAVDAHTAAYLYDKCLKGPLLRDRTVILVSHHTQLCAPGAGRVVHLDNGSVSFDGSAEEYMKLPLFSKDQAEDDLPEEKSEVVAAKLTNKNLERLLHPNHGGSTASSSSEISSSSVESESEDEPEKPAAPPRKLIEEEARAVGRVSTDVWMYYIKANGGAIFWVIFATIFISTKGFDVLETFWVRVWSSSYDTAERGQEGRSVDYYLTVYAIITLLNVFVETGQWLILYIGGLRASHQLFQALLTATLRAPLRFFDTMALGRLLNRFGKDVEQIDAQLPDHLGRTIMYLLGVVTTLVTIASVSPIFILFFALLCLVYFYYAKLYAKTAREMRRLDSVTKSPVFSLYGEAIAGVAVIRAFGASARFMLTQIHYVDRNMTFYFYLWSSNRWLSVRFDVLSSLLVGVTSIILLLFSSTINASIAGFALTFALDVTHNVLFVVRRYTALELAMVGVERVKEYCELQQEPPAIIEPRPPASWPERGEVDIRSLCIRYAPELPRVLHDVSFKIQPGEKVGIVGATGSGKSSLALSFFRFVEADAGSILIDGIDISKIGLQDLRSRLTIIPQDPTILSGTIRSTLDPLDEYDDVEIFDSLKRARLLPVEPVANEIEDLNYNPFYNLDTEVAEQGQNFSAGERQLLCLARALLIQHRLILMDEATSSIDYETDAIITTTIAEEFRTSSLLVIAHRLRTVIAFDKILVLDAGRVAEFDSPAKLLEDQNSRFHALCKATGRREFKILTRLAKKAYPPGAVVKRKKAKRSSSGRQDSK